jgi:hypothetical protein
MFDLHGAGDDGFIASERFAELLRGQASVELLPVTIVDHAGNVRPERYSYVNPLAIECLVIERCDPSWNHINRESISDYGALVIDRDKLGGAQIFRPARLTSQPVVVTRELAARLGKLDGVRISYARR